MYEILLPADDSETRTNQQVSFVLDMPVAAEELHVTLTHALEADEREAPASMQNPGRVRTVKQADDRLTEAGVETSVRETTPPVEDGIVRLAEEIEADQIVMGGHKRSPAGKAIFGSVTQSVLLETDRPVTVTGGEE